MKSAFYFAFAQNASSCRSQVKSLLKSLAPWLLLTLRQSIRWNVFFAIDILTELVLLVLPVFQVWNLQMPLKRKLTIIAAFYLRIPVFGMSIGRWWYTNHLCQSDVDAGRESAIVLIWLSVETSYAIASTTFSALKAFAMNFNSAFGLGFTINAGPDSYSLSRVNKNGSSNLASGGNDSSQVVSQSAGEQKDRILVHQREIDVEQERRTPPSSFPRTFTQISANGRHHAYPEHGWREDVSTDSERAGDGMVIRRDTEYTVDYYGNSDEYPILPDRFIR